MRLDYDTSRKTVMEYLVPRAVYRPPPALPAFIQQQGPPGRHASPPYFSESSSLLIRHLPEDYSYGEVADFLGGLGAKTVKYFGATGRLKNIAIAEFDSPANAIFVMQKLHQIKLRRRRLVVEFAEDHLRKHHPNHAIVKTSLAVADGSPKRQKNEEAEKKLDRENIFYKYPAATPSILSNITYSLAEVPLLYVQVLHLMNKMNLPVPFGLARHPATMCVQSGREEVNTEIPMDVSSDSTSESEIEEETAEPCSSLKKVMKLPRSDKPRKKLKVAVLIESAESEPHGIRREIPIQTVFDQNKFRENNFIRIEAPTLSTITATSDAVVVGGFGRIDPPAPPDTLSVTPSGEFISQEQLLSNHISQEEMATASVFSNYSPGNPSAKLYVKNLAKAVDEEDLKFIFGRYVNWESERERSGFDIRLMSTGRMKGQAFITMPSQTKAEVAVREVNGYILQGKPVVVTFSRSKD